jgi:hypothetical protein
MCDARAGCRPTGGRAGVRREVAREVRREVAREVRWEVAREVRVEPPCTAMYEGAE